MYMPQANNWMDRNDTVSTVTDNIKQYMYHKCRNILLQT